MRAVVCSGVGPGGFGGISVLMLPDLLPLPTFYGYVYAEINYERPY